MLLAHFSDVHVSSVPLGWRPADYFNKRLSGWANLHVLGRAGHFRHAADRLASMMADLRRQRPAHIVFSGDATGLGFENEMAETSRILFVDEAGGLPGLAVPGNHDYYTQGAADSGSFEQRFDAWQQGERIEGYRYPFAQRAGSFWLVAVNSSTPNRGLIDASGAVGPEQRTRLQTLLNRLTPEPRILVTHYPICLADGQPEKRLHGLRDLTEVLAAIRNRGVCLWLHGHRHHAYHLQRPPTADFPVICSGSGTQHGRASYGLYDLAGKSLHGRRRQFNPERNQFEDAEWFQLELAC